MGRVTRKCPLCPESFSYQKKDGRAWPHPPFFWYDTDFSKKIKINKIKQNLKKKVGVFPKERQARPRAPVSVLV